MMRPQTEAGQRALLRFFVMSSFIISYAIFCRSGMISDYVLDHLFDPRLHKLSEYFVRNGTPCFSGDFLVNVGSVK